MKSKSIFSGLKKPVLYSAVPAALFAIFGTAGNSAPAPETDLYPTSLMTDTLPGDTTDLPDQDTSGYPTDVPEDAWPADTSDATEGLPGDDQGLPPSDLPSDPNDGSVLPNDPSGGFPADTSSGF